MCICGRLYVHPRLRSPEAIMFFQVHLLMGKGYTIKVFTRGLGELRGFGQCLIKNVFWK